MIRVLAAILIIVLPLQALAADDLLGWQNTRWEMTEVEAAVALGSEAVRTNPPEKFQKMYSPAKVSVRIGAYELVAKLQFSTEDKKLRQVIIQAPNASIELWAKLRDLLTEKYGQPSQAGTLREWRFKTTVVELTRLSMPGIIGLTTIRYYPATNYRDEKSKL